MHEGTSGAIPGVSFLLGCLVAAEQSAIECLAHTSVAGIGFLMIDAREWTLTFR